MRSQQHKNSRILSSSKLTRVRVMGLFLEPTRVLCVLWVLVPEPEWRAERTASSASSLRRTNLQASVRKRKNKKEKQRIERRIEGMVGSRVTLAACAGCCEGCCVGWVLAGELALARGLDGEPMGDRARGNGANDIWPIGEKNVGAENNVRYYKAGGG